ncbi:hypothetical protein CYLTODRAFT_424132 [Cylindrobasidium torrendii FP15055 ss-10]|uniref:Uncharacterized protein n=1 Tax=Cylindrobasidium torrendii FP15055 ss-10 TaxID=1314674 RepID=A0A0D7B5A5_9AGAR|nr:hypothetical protein CYLTODRAFT_424132 [Cylindrobasidium torrendii FP15055 ss-10]
MGYGRVMGFPCQNFGKWAKNLWGMTSYGFKKVWVISSSTVSWDYLRANIQCEPFNYNQINE